MIKGDRELSSSPARNTSRLGRYKYPFLNVVLLTVLAPAVLACSGRPVRSNSPVIENPGRSGSTQGRPPMSAEDEELVKFGKEILELRKDCVVVSLEDEVTSLRRGVRTYEAAQIRSGDPNRNKIEASRYANSGILKEEADKLRDKSRADQARELSLVYLALARANLQVSKDETGTYKAELVDFAKCGFVKYVSLQAILEEMGTDRSKRQRISWAPGIEV